MTAAPRMPVPGDVLLERFRVDSVIGEGGMGLVLGARRLSDDAAVAIKVLSPSAQAHPEAIPRFINEARATMQLKSAHVVRVFEAGTLEIGLPFIVMELLEGSDLAALVTRRGTLPIAEAVDYVIQAGDAIAEAHAHGIVHRDLKPSNLFLTSSTATPERGATRNIIKVLDFGISKSTGLGAPVAALTTSGSFLGSPHYMSPEQLKNARDVDARADIWSLGVILYELVGGHPPFDGGAFGEIFVKVMTGELEPLRSLRPNVPEALEDVIARCLRKNRDERYENIAALVRALVPFASPEGVARAQQVAGPFAPPAASRSAPRLFASTAVMQDRPDIPVKTPSSGRVLSAPYQKEILTVPASYRAFDRSIGTPAPAPARGHDPPPKVARSTKTTLALFLVAATFALVGIALILIALRARSRVPGVKAPTSILAESSAEAATTALSLPPPPPAVAPPAPTPDPEPAPLPSALSSSSAAARGAAPSIPAILNKRK